MDTSFLQHYAPVRAVYPIVELLLRGGNVEVQLPGDVGLDGVDVAEASRPAARREELVHDSVHGLHCHGIIGVGLRVEEEDVFRDRGTKWRIG